MTFSVVMISSSRLLPFEVEELHADRLCCKDLDEAVSLHAVLGDESFENVEALWGDLEDGTLLESRI